VELLSIASVPNFSLYLESGQLPIEFLIGRDWRGRRNPLKRFSKIVKALRERRCEKRA
jgi:hypothetical protein